MPGSIVMTLVDEGLICLWTCFGNKPKFGGFAAYESPFVNKGKTALGTWWVDNPVITLVTK